MTGEARQDLERQMLDRLARLETALHYERALTSREMADLYRRLAALETWRTAPPGLAGYVKLALAVAVPLAVLVLTGSMDKARQAASLMP